MQGVDLEELTPEQTQGLLRSSRVELVVKDERFTRDGVSPNRTKQETSRLAALQFVSGDMVCTFSVFYVFLVFPVFCVFCVLPVFCVFCVFPLSCGLLRRIPAQVPPPPPPKLPKLPCVVRVPAGYPRRLISPTSIHLSSFIS